MAHEPHTMNPAERRSSVASLALVLLVATVAGCVALLQPVTALDRRILDAQFGLARSTPAAPVEGAPEVVVVGGEKRNIHPAFFAPTSCGATTLRVRTAAAH